MPLALDGCGPGALSVVICEDEKMSELMDKRIVIKTDDERKRAKKRNTERESERARGGVGPML